MESKIESKKALKTNAFFYLMLSSFFYGFMVAVNTKEEFLNNPLWEIFKYCTCGVFFSLMHFIINYIYMKEGVCANDKIDEEKLYYILTCVFLFPGIGLAFYKFMYLPDSFSM